jgi:hypothetical protein
VLYCSALDVSHHATDWLRLTPSGAATSSIEQQPSRCLHSKPQLQPLCYVAAVPPQSNSYHPKLTGAITLPVAAGPAPAFFCCWVRGPQAAGQSSTVTSTVLLASCTPWLLDTGLTVTLLYTCTRNNSPYTQQQQQQQQQRLMRHIARRSDRQPA